MNEADISAVGLDPDSVKHLVERAHREIDEGLLPSCQLALARDGKVVLDETFGAPAGSRYVIFSATKAIVATATWILVDEGRLRLEQPIGAVIPEFAQNGKGAVTLEQVMLHTSGFPRAPLGPADWGDRAARLAVFGRWGLNWEPGTRFEYHPTSAHWVLAELIERVSGSDYRTFIRERVLEPFGMRRFQLGAPEREQHDINELAKIGEPPSPDELEAAIGLRELPVTEVTAEALLGFNSPGARAVGVPGGGGVSTAADLALFYQRLLAGGMGVMSSNAHHEFTAVVRNRFPDFLGVPANRSLGLVIAGDDGRSNLRGMGKTVSPRAYGHNGAGGQIAFADPETGVSFVYLTNGLDQHMLREGRRTTGIASRAAACAAN